MISLDLIFEAIDITLNVVVLKGLEDHELLVLAAGYEDAQTSVVSFSWPTKKPKKLLIEFDDRKKD
jgi:hypothetical protein